jgi:acetoin utilization protein AcuC
MAGRTAFVYDDELLKYDFGPFHPLKPERVLLTFRLVEALGLLDDKHSCVRKPRTANLHELLLFHTYHYIKEIQQASLEGHGRLDQGDTPAFKGCYEVSSAVVGATLKALDLVMAKAFDHAFNPSGGLHHARRDRASGFCIFNDAAVGIAYLMKRYDLKRIMYVDMDAHHGDGVMYGFYDDPRLLDIDFHEDGRFLFPGTGEVTEVGEGSAKGLKINIPLPPMSSDTSYVYAFDRLVPRFAKKFKPEFIVFQCGADAHRGDSIAHLCLTTKAYEHAASVIHEIAHRACEGRLVALGGGGYNLSNTCRCWSIVYKRMADISCLEEIPKAWRESFQSLTRETAPSQLHDPEIQHFGKENQVPEDILDNVQRIEAIIGDSVS